jgi:hypothetical protein
MGPLSSKAYGTWLATGSAVNSLPGISSMTGGIRSALHPSKTFSALKEFAADRIIFPPIRQIAEDQDTDQYGNTIPRAANTLGQYIQEGVPRTPLNPKWNREHLPVAPIRR